MKTKLTLALSLILFTAIGCSNSAKEQQIPLKQINISEEPDFVDLQLTITKYWQDEHNNHMCRAEGLWDKDTVGFEIAFKSDMEPGLIDNEVNSSGFKENGITFYSIGKSSDNFIKALISLYKIDKKPLKMTEKVSTTIFVLGGEPKNFASEYIKTKVFLDDELGESYAEWFVNVDLKNKVLELREKDTEYRENIINNLIR